MGKKEISLILNNYAKQLELHLQFKKLILFGSYARGTANNNSDIDTAVVIKKLKGNFLETSALLWKLAAEIDSRIEPILIEEGKDESGFLEDITRYGEIIVSN